MNVFASGSRHQPWVWQVTGLCFVLGLLLAGSIQTVGNIRRGGGTVRVGQAPFPGSNPQLSKVVEQKEQQIRELNEGKTRLENSLAEKGGAAKTLNEELQKMKMIAGLTAVEGPGIAVILQDSKPPSNRQFDAENYIIHDITLQRLMNELNASGAEAISINGQRVTSRTAIRCVGPTALVNNVPLASPYEVRVIGDAATLIGALNIPEGFMEFMRSVDPKMARIEKRARLEIPAYTGSTDFRFSKLVPIKEKPAQEAKL